MTELVEEMTVLDDTSAQDATVKDASGLVLSVSCKLVGEDARRFRAHMGREKILLVSVVARKLILERLEEIESEMRRIESVA